jgi:acyl dehydratase
MKIERKSRRDSGSHVFLGAAAHPAPSVHASYGVRAGDILRAPSRRLTASHAGVFPSVSVDGLSAHRDAGGGGRHGHSTPACSDLPNSAFTASGASLFPRLMGEFSVRFLEMSVRFMAEVHPGDILHPMLIVTGLRVQEEASVVTARATIHNQDGELVLSGQHKYLLFRTLVPAPASKEQHRTGES